MERKEDVHRKPVKQVRPLDKPEHDVHVDAPTVMMPTALTSEWVNNLKSTAFFDGLAHEEVVALSRRMERKESLEGDCLFKEGEEGDSLWVVLAGGLSIYKRKGNGEQVKVTTFGPGSTFGELSLLDGEKRSATCVVATKSVLASISREEFAKLADERPDLALKVAIRLARALAMRLRKTTVVLAQALGQKEPI